MFVTFAGTSISLAITTLSGYALSVRIFEAVTASLSFYIFLHCSAAADALVYYDDTGLKTYRQRMGSDCSSLVALSIFVVRNYIKTSIPLELFESAKIDGASEMTTL